MLFFKERGVDIAMDVFSPQGVSGAGGFIRDNAGNFIEIMEWSDHEGVL